MNTRTKKIIFIGGTVRSGTTLLNLIIANEERVLALGEVFWLFNPIQRTHLDLIKSLEEDSKWRLVLNGGQGNLYKNLEEAFPEIDVFVDSSKDPFWIKKHIALNSNQFDVRNILIFKSPEEFAQSKLKRNEGNWPKVYVNYHRRYVSLVNDFVAISYFDLVNDDNKFCQAMRSLGLSDGVEKRRYWNTHHPYNFFGSGSIRASKSNEMNEQLRESIEYDRVRSDSIYQSAEVARLKDPRISSIYETLSKRSSATKFDFTYSRFELEVLRLKDRLLRFFLRCRRIYWSG